VSLASQTAKTASNMNLALTLNWFVRELEDSHRAGRADLPINTALDMINMHLTELEQERVRLINDERVKRELANDKTLAEVLS
jgi:hypothetical protein